jgi:hypothetical protein
MLAPLAVSACATDMTALWQRTVSPFLLDPQWQREFAYDAGHVLMGPLHAAFRDRNSGRIGEFDSMSLHSNLLKSNLPYLVRHPRNIAAGDENPVR